MQGVHQERGMPGGQEESISKKSFESEFDEILETQGVHGRFKPSKGTISKEIMQRVCSGQTYSKSKILEEIMLERA
jgi:hypothetical protein